MAQKVQEAEPVAWSPPEQDTVEGVAIERRFGAPGPESTASLYSDDRVERICAALAIGNTRRASAAAGNISIRTFNYWMQRYPAFAARAQEAEAEAERRAMGTIQRAAQKGIWTAAAWFLERRYPEDFGRVDRVEMTLRREKAQEIIEQLATEGVEITEKELMDEFRAYRRRALPPGSRS